MMKDEKLRDIGVKFSRGRLSLGPTIMMGLFATLLTSCAMGPNFHAPAKPTVQRYTPEPLPKSTASASTLHGKKQFFEPQQTIPKQWWSVFHSKSLNRYITDVLQHNPDLEAASAALKVAHENTLAQKGAFFPTVGINYTPTRQLTPRTFASNLASNAYLYTLNLASLNISYMPDVFGLTRRRVESAAADEETAHYQREAVALTLTSQAVVAVIREASLRAQLVATQRTITLATALMSMVEQQRKLGLVDEDALLAQQTVLAQAQAALPPLQQALAQQQHFLAVLAGRLPGDHATQTWTLDELVLPQRLPLSLPSQLVEQRPDIRAAEAQMHAASATVGITTANRFPSLTLSATTGFAPVSFSEASVPLFMPSFPPGTSGFWGLGAGALGTLFNGGILLHQQRAAVHAYEVTTAQYKQVVLASFQQVADTLKTIQFDAEALKSALLQHQAAKQNWLSSKTKKQLGAVGYLYVLQAELAYQQAQMNLVNSQTNRLNDTAALFQALGGGWTSREAVV